MSRKLSVPSAAAVALLIALVASALADLAAVGAVDPVTDFPRFYEDQAGVRVVPCNVPTPEGEPGCPGLELEDPSGEFVAGNIAEFTYYRAEANLPNDGGGNTPNGERFRLRIEVQGGADGPPLVSNAVRVRLRNLVVPGTYRVVTPLGRFEFSALRNSKGEVDDIDEEVLGVAGEETDSPPFSGALPGLVQCFWPNGTGFDDPAAGHVFLGDALTEAPLQIPAGCAALPPGGELVLRVIGPGNVGAIETDLFSVEGKLR